jgi:hypothetical protein
MPGGEFLPPFSRMKGVQKYLADRFGKGGAPAPTPESMLEECRSDLEAKCQSKRWLRISLSHLRRLEAAAGTLLGAKDGTPAGCSRRRQYAITEAELEKEPPEHCPEHAADGQPWIPAERVTWMAWRHAFGSLLAQAGVSLDKTSAWMGNTPDICRRHYAEFVPRDFRDDEIDKL